MVLLFYSSLHFCGCCRDERKEAKKRRRKSGKPRKGFFSSPGISSLPLYGISNVERRDRSLAASFHTFLLLRHRTVAKKGEGGASIVGRWLLPSVWRHCRGEPPFPTFRLSMLNAVWERGSLGINSIRAPSSPTPFIWYRRAE